MSLPHHSEETHQNLLLRVPSVTGRELPDWFRAIEDGPAFARFDERVSWFQDEYGIPHGHALAIVREHDKRRNNRG